MQQLLKPSSSDKEPSGKAKIKAGHHRFTVARRIGIPVKYVICDELSEVTIQELEEAKGGASAIEEEKAIPFLE